MGKKGAELQEQDLENVGGGWHIYHLPHSLNGPIRGFHIIYKGRKVGKTAQTEEEALQEAKRLGLDLKDKKTHEEDMSEDWWTNRSDTLPSTFWF